MLNTQVEVDTSRELDHRESDGFTVSLRWDPVTNRVFVRGLDREGVLHERTVEDGEKASDVFDHFFALV